jgi:hypothetical protein
MISRLYALLSAGSAVFASVVLIEFSSTTSKSPALHPSPPQAEIKAAPVRTPELNVDDLVAVAQSRPLFSPTRRPPERSSPEKVADSELDKLRLTGIIIEPDRRLAIFAVPGAKPLVRSEGEALKDWTLDRITPDEVSLIGPEGTRTLEPKPDANLVRPRPPTLASSGQPQSGSSPGVAGAASPAQPQRGTPQAGAFVQPASAVSQLRPTTPPVGGLNNLPRRLAHDDSALQQAPPASPMPPALPSGGAAPTPAMPHPPHDQ